MKKKILLLIFTREFPLILCEIWGKSYREFWDIKPETFPRNIFIIEDGLVADYRNSDLIKELQNLFYKRSRGKKNYFRNLYTSWLREYKILEAYWSRSYLGKLELVRTGELIRAFWPAMFASIFIPLDKRFSKKDRDLMIKLRAEIGELADKATHIIIKSLEKHFPKLGSLVCLVTLADLRKTKIDKNKLIRLSKSKLIMSDDRFITLKEFSNLQKKYNFELQKTDAKQTSLLSGQIAYKGKAEGRIRIIQRRADLGSFNQGEVLVSSMTVPDFLPAMKIAAAIVTDEGGITCHAAIVSRELKKPCIIGTKIATKVLKDGDLVEVDADRGWVRLVSPEARRARKIK